MTEKEEEIIRKIVKDFNDFYGYDPTWWYKTRRGEDGFMFSPQGVSCLIAAGGKDLYGDFDEVAQEIPEGFEWMGFSTVYSVTEMSLLAGGLVDKDSRQDLILIARLLDKTMKEGHWIRHEYAEEYEGAVIDNYECSECHYWVRDKSYYCPECGAKMSNEEGVL